MKRLRFLLFLLSLVSLGSCALFRSAPLPAKAGKGAKAGSEAKTDAGDPDKPLPRPRRAAGELLRSWLASQENRYSIQRMDDCQAQMLAVSEGGKRQNELKKLSKQLKADVGANLELHHWCFYHMLMRLEMKLEQSSLGDTYHERLQSFIRESKALWVLAMALDRQIDDHYYSYVARKRYIALSQLYFGRNLLPAKGTLDPEDDPEAVDDDEVEDPDEDDEGGDDSEDEAEASPPAKE